MNQYSFTEKDHTFKRIKQELYEDIYDTVSSHPCCHRMPYGFCVSS